MLIAIDESGSFGSDTDRTNLFVAVRLRQHGKMFERKRIQFLDWEKTLPRRLKDPKGEFKGSALSDLHLLDFATRIYQMPAFPGITPVALRPARHEPCVIAKHRHVTLVGIREGVKGYLALGRPAMAQTCEEMGNWFQNLDDSIFLKILLLGQCIVNSFTNSVGHAISDGYDTELTNLQFVIDRDFVRGPRYLTFWREILRNQLWQITQKTPMLIPSEWRSRGHPFLDKFIRDGKPDLNELFTKNLSFAPSHQHPELRIADMTAAIISRYLNYKRCSEAFIVVRRAFLHHGKIELIELNDFDLDSWRYDPTENPYGQFPQS
jgi:hypothetical protein